MLSTMLCISRGGERPLWIHFKDTLATLRRVHWSEMTEFLQVLNNQNNVKTPSKSSWRTYYTGPTLWISTLDRQSTVNKHHAVPSLALWDRGRQSSGLKYETKTKRKRGGTCREIAIESLRRRELVGPESGGAITPRRWNERRSWASWSSPNGSQNTCGAGGKGQNVTLRPECQVLWWKPGTSRGAVNGLAWKVALAAAPSQKRLEDWWDVRKQRSAGTTSKRAQIHFSIQTTNHSAETTGAAMSNGLWGVKGH